MLSDYVTLSVEDGSKILLNTMENLGFSNDLALYGVKSSLWLESRGLGGIIELIVYLNSIKAKNKSLGSLEPYMHEKIGITGYCPFMLSRFVIQHKELWINDGYLASGAPYSVLLYLPEIVELISKTQNKAILVEHQDYSVIVSRRGWRLESEQSGMFQLPHYSEDPLFCRFIDEPEELDFGAEEEIKSIKLPKARLMESGLLHLG